MTNMKLEYANKNSGIGITIVLTLKDIPILFAIGVTLYKLFAVF